MAGSQYNIPLNYATSAQTAITRPTVANVPAYQAGDGDWYYHIDSLGMPQYMIQDIMVTMFGRQALFLPTAFEDIYNRMKPIDNYLVKRRRGRELTPNYLVKSTVTGNGTGLESVQIEIALEGGAGERALSVGHEVVSIGRRNFIVTDESVGASGFQYITLKPNDGLANLSVVGSASTEFPTNTKFGTLGVSKMINGCTQNFHELYVGNDEFISFKMSRKFMQFVRRRDFLQNQMVEGAVVPFKVGIDEDPNNKVNLFITVQEMRELVRFFNAVNASILYSQENLNPSMGTLLGNGLAYSTDPALRFPYSPSQINAKWINDILFRYRQDNPDHGELVWILGDAIWDQVMYNLDQTYRPWRMEAPNHSFEDIAKQFAAGPNQYDRYMDVFGTKVRFMRLSALSQRAISGTTSPRNPNMGITAHDWFLLDMGPLHNINLQTGAWQAEADHKINFYSAKNLVDGSADSLTDVNLTGTVDARGVTIARGDVTTLNDYTTRQLEMSYGVELADKFSAYWGFLG